MQRSRRRTVIAIADRVSTYAQMDRIVVPEQGTIAAAGRRATRLARGGGLPWLEAAA